ncbi:MAG: hypothetical protein HRT37_01325 [Alteromonadaceae bacterium]|nr:hypothetical protein [Alteromonadaceae bacterium]
MDFHDELKEPVHVKIKDKGVYLFHLSKDFTEVVTEEAKKKKMPPYDLLCCFVSDNLEKIDKEERFLGKNWLIKMERYRRE